MPLIVIDQERCLKDGLCTRICKKVFTQTEEASVPSVVNEGSCNLCGHCVLICPSGAIRLDEYPPGHKHRVQNNLLPSYEQVREMVVARRSIRTFQKKPVQKDMIEKIIDAARYAPSAKNTQSTRFIVVQDKALLRAIAAATAAWLGKTAQRLKNPLWRRLYQLRGVKDTEEIKRWIGQFELIASKMQQNVDLILFDAPVLLMFYGDITTRFANENANLAIQNATLIATTLGLGSFYTGYIVTACYNDRSIPKLLNLPKGHRIYGGLALGYPEIRFSHWIERNPPKITWI